MQAQSELLSLPQTLADLFTKGLADHERAVRGIRWGDGPVYVLTEARSLPAGLVARYVIEELLHRPVLIREAASFLAYSLGTLRTGSVMVAVSGQGKAGELLEAVRAARSTGAQVLAVSPASSSVAEASHQVFVVPELAGTPADGLAGACLEHAAMGYLSLIAARQLTRPTPLLVRAEKDWADLPAQLNKVVTQFGTAVLSLASQLGALNKVFFAGAGLYDAAALRAADAGRHAGRVLQLALDFARLQSGWLGAFGSESGALLLTGSRSRSREDAGALGRELRQRGAAVFAITDANDHDLGPLARMTLLLPDLAELPASILALALAGWVSRELAQRSSPSSASRVRDAARSGSGR